MRGRRREVLCIAAGEGLGGAPSEEIQIEGGLPPLCLYPLAAFGFTVFTAAPVSVSVAAHSMLLGGHDAPLTEPLCPILLSSGVDPATNDSTECSVPSASLSGFYAAKQLWQGRRRCLLVLDHGSVGEGWGKAKLPCIPPTAVVCLPSVSLDGDSSGSVAAQGWQCGC